MFQLISYSQGKCNCFLSNKGNGKALTQADLCGWTLMRKSD